MKKKVKKIFSDFFGYTALELFVADIKFWVREDSSVLGQPVTSITSKKVIDNSLT